MEAHGPSTRPRADSTAIARRKWLAPPAHPVLGACVPRRSDHATDVRHGNAVAWGMVASKLADALGCNLSEKCIQFSDVMAMMDSVQDGVLRRIRSAGRGRVFTPKDFLGIASRPAIDQALSRLARSGDIQRLGRGLYYYPRVNARLAIPEAPDADQIAQAIGRRTGSRMIPSGAMAANIFGLSTQVPAKPVYLSDGRSRRIRVGNMEFQIRHIAPKQLPRGSLRSVLIIQALRHLGQKSVDARVVAQLKSVIRPGEKRELLRDARYTTDWIAAIARQIAEDGPARKDQ